MPNRTQNIPMVANSAHSRIVVWGNGWKMPKRKWPVCGALLFLPRGACRRRDNVWQRRRSGWRALAKVLFFTEERSHGGRDLRLGNRRNLRTLAQSFRIRPHRGNPDILRSFLIHAMFFP